MKRTLALFAAIFSLAGATLQSQAPAPAAQPALQKLQAIRDANAKLLEQQTKTLLQLEEMDKTAQTIKVLGKRS